MINAAYNKKIVPIISRHDISLYCSKDFNIYPSLIWYAKRWSNCTNKFV